MKNIFYIISLILLTLSINSFGQEIDNTSDVIVSHKAIRSVFRKISELTSTITGTVRDQDGNPIKGVLLRLYNADESVDLYAVILSDGSYSFNDVPPGKYFLVAKRDNYRIFSTVVNVVLVPNAPVIVNDSLKVAFKEVAYADTIKVEDPDEGDTFNFSLMDNPEWLTIDDSGNLSGKPSKSDVGTDSLSIRVEDKFGLADTLNTTITVYPSIFVEEYKPLQYRIYPPFPNPFNSIITIQYEIPAECHVILVIYDMIGREITTLQDNIMSAGLHETVWDGRNKNGLIVSSGVYLYQFKADSYTNHGKVILLR